MTEWGLFNDEGLVEGDFSSREQAESALANYDPEDELTTHEVCPDCRDGRADSCDNCEIPE